MTTPTSGRKAVISVAKELLTVSTSPLVNNTNNSAGIISQTVNIHAGYSEPSIPAVNPPKHVSHSLQDLEHVESYLESHLRWRTDGEQEITNPTLGTTKKKHIKHRRCQSQSITKSMAPPVSVSQCHLHDAATCSALPLAPPHYSRSHSAVENERNEKIHLHTCDTAANVEDVINQKLETMTPRLVVISSRVRNVSVLRHALLPGVTLVQYNYDTQSLDDILASISQSLNGRLVYSIAFILSCQGTAIQITSVEDKIISRDSLHDKAILDFFSKLKDSHCCKEALSGLHFDFLACSGFPQGDASVLGQELEAKLGVTIAVRRDLIGVDTGQRKDEETTVISNSCIGELYFHLEKLRSWSGQHQQSLAGFEKIRTVGKGAYGVAVLYKKKDDDSLVILKEINMHDLTASERQLALNEVKVLAMLDHPNIISYFDSFEEDGVLMIEMEYADGGTLAQYLAQQDQSSSTDREREILTMFHQIVAAIHHIHQHNVLHRDLKTNNIFLTKEGIIKVGDFGISKMLGSVSNGAQTVLGTPYYISPEMCEGKPYSYKSDIWALGCILYEMATLQKTFEGSNLPALVNKIMKGQFAPIKGNYSAEFRALVSDMLQHDPDLRPSTNDILYIRLQELLCKFEDSNSDLEEELVASTGSISHKVKIRSVLYYLESSTGTMTCITGLPPRMKIKQVGVSLDHVVVVTTERQVYSWGRGDKGQLGHGDNLDRISPALIEALKGKSIMMVCCGENFSVFGSDNGLVLTCGDGSNGCLGHGDWASIPKPRLIEALLSIDVAVMACGPKHVVVLGRDGQVFSWGQGEHGQLGLGSHDSHCQPMKVQIEEPVVFRDVKCGVDGTMFITKTRGLFACGFNEYNKLGLNNRQGFLMAMKNIFAKTEVEGKNVPTPVRALACHLVVAVAMGQYHTAVIVEAGHVYMFGRNSEGQLGTGNVKVTHAPIKLRLLADKTITHVRCGDHFTIASTRDHQLFYWGLRYTTTPWRPASGNTSAPSSASANNSSWSSITSSTSGASGTRDETKEEITPRNISEISLARDMQRDYVASENDKCCVQNISGENHGDSGISMATTERSGEGTDTGGISSLSQNESGSGFRPLSHTAARRSPSAVSHDSGKERDHEKEKEMLKDDAIILFEPMEIIRIKQAHEKVLLGNMFCHGENLFIQVETTAPPPRRRTFKKRSFRRRLQHMATQPECPHNSKKRFSKTTHESGDDYSSETSEADFHHGEYSVKLEKDELLNENDDDGNEADNTSDMTDDDNLHAVVDSSMSSIHINHALTPVKRNEILTPKTTKTNKHMSFNSDATPSLQERTNSDNSIESHRDKASSEQMSDGSLSEPQINRVSRELGTPHSSHSRSSLAVQGKIRGLDHKPFTRGRLGGRGKGKSPEEALRERLTAHGFVSDVTVKRREEALLCELELVREEKRRIESQVKALQQERELHSQKVRQEAEQLAKAREQELIEQVERLRQELQAQTSQLVEGQRLLGHLQTQLQSAHHQTEMTPHLKQQQPTGNLPLQPAPQRDGLPLLSQSSSPTPTTTNSQGNVSSKSTESVHTPRAQRVQSAGGSVSKVCIVQ